MGPITAAKCRASCGGLAVGESGSIHPSGFGESAVVGGLIGAGLGCGGGATAATCVAAAVGGYAAVVILAFWRPAGLWSVAVAFMRGTLMLPVDAASLLILPSLMLVVMGPAILMIMDSMGGQ